MKILRSPGAWVPLLMSLAALSMVLVHYARFGIVHEEDEGTAAHIFQLLMVLQLPVILFFAIRWLPREPKGAAGVLVLQALAGAAAVTSVVFLTG